MALRIVRGSGTAVTLEERVRRMIEAVPSEGAVTLPVETLRQWLEESAAEAAREPDPEDDLVNQVRASELSGYSPRRLRELEEEGKVVNHGDRHRPLYRPDELPRNPRRAPRPRPAGYDPDADAREVLG